ncbi:MAG: hypothetical protein KC416_02925 [Myxococcales bacterium]|nr:hypothetical protein [Myxococcales bacterium]
MARELLLHPAIRVLKILALVGLLSAPVVAGIVYYKRMAAVTYGSDGDRILFVGNSITNQYGVPEMIVDLSRSAPSPKEFQARWFLQGGATLRDLDQSGELADIMDDEWDFVVLQPQSLEGLETSAAGSKLFRGVYGDRAQAILDERYDSVAFDAKVEELSNRTRDKGGRPVLFYWLPFGPRHEQYHLAPIRERQADLGQYYPAFVDVSAERVVRAAEDVGAKAAALGPVTFACMREAEATGASNVRLILSDENHPTLAGSYMNAWLLFVELVDGSGIAADGDWWRPEGLSAEDAAWVRSCGLRNRHGKANEMPKKLPVAPLGLAVDEEGAYRYSVIEVAEPVWVGKGGWAPGPDAPLGWLGEWQGTLAEAQPEDRAGVRPLARSGGIVVGHHMEGGGNRTWTLDLDRDGALDLVFASVLGGKRHFAFVRGPSAHALFREVQDRGARALDLQTPRAEAPATPAEKAMSAKKKPRIRKRKKGPTRL